MVLYAKAFKQKGTRLIPALERKDGPPHSQVVVK